MTSFVSLHRAGIFFELCSCGRRYRERNRTNEYIDARCNYLKE